MRIFERIEYHLLLAKDLGYLPEDEYKALDVRLAEMKRMLVALTRKVGQEPKDLRGFRGDLASC